MPIAAASSAHDSASMIVTNLWGAITAWPLMLGVLLLLGAILYVLLQVRHRADHALAPTPAHPIAPFAQDR